MIPLLKALRRPEYFYNPRQLLRRSLSYFKNEPKGLVQARMFGGEFSYSCRDDIGRALRSFGLYDLCVSESLWRLAEKNSTVLDIGANMGYFSVLLSEKVGARGEVQAFEPNPQILELLKLNIESRKNIILNTVALSNTNGSQTLFGPKNYNENRGLASLSEASGVAIATVPLCTLDSLKLKPSLIKMDVEGHELKVLEGGVETLKTVQHVVFEDHDLENNGVKTILENSGFTVYYLEKKFSSLSLVDVKDAFKINPTEPPNYLATKWSPQKIREAFSKGGWRVLTGMKQ